MTDFDGLIDQVAEGAVTLPPDWGQGRATFGGVLGALAYEAMHRQLPDARPLRSLSVSFIGPVPGGETVAVQSEVLRQGKAVTQAESRLLLGEEPALVALASFGAGRESRVRVPGIPAPNAPEVEACRELPRIEGVTPAFTQHIEMRFGIGGFPFSGHSGREMGGWMRFRQPPREITPAHVIALVDAWPPAVLPLLSQPAPASSLTWTLEMIQPQPEIGPEDWLLYRAEIEQAADGYGVTHAGIWTRQGELVALSRQTVTVFA